MDPYLQSYQAALAEELEAYERRGDEERARAVRAEIARVRKQIGPSRGAPRGEAETTTVEPTTSRRRSRRT